MLPASGLHGNSAGQLRRGWALVAGLILAALVGDAAFAADRMAGAALPAAEAQQIAPMALRLDDATGVALRIDLSPATVPATVRKGRGPLRIGIHRELPPRSRGDLLPRLNWMPVGNGAVAAAVLVSSPEAASIRVGVTAELPAGAELRFFEPNGEVYAVVDLEDLAGAEEIFWSPSADGEVLGFEITLPSRAAIGTSSFRVAKVAHRFLDPRSTRLKSLDCPELHIDVQCRVDEFPSGLENAVARLDFETDRGSAMCSGTLLNDGDADTFIPYFLTANHCLATAEEARTVQATWFHQRASCETEAVDPRANTTFGGADIVATSEPHDATLLRLRRRLPAGVFFSGWDAQEVLAADAVVGIHHPAGVVKKYSAGEVAGKQDSDDVLGAIEVLWDEGVTEGGSSGSAIFRDGLAIGALSHGNVCTSGIYRDFYGPFARFFPQVCSALNPGTGCGDGAHDVPLTARAIAAGGSATDAIDEAGDVDYWRIAVPSYGTLIVETTGNADTVGTLESENGTVLATDDDGGTGGNFRIERVVESGTYFVRIAGAGGVGDYVLRVDHTPIPIDALPRVAWGEGTAGALAEPDGIDRWRFDLEATAAVNLRTSGNVDTVGALEDASGVPLARNDDDDGGYGVNFRIETFLPAGGYLLKISGYQGETGAYTLHASQTPTRDIPAVSEGGDAGAIDEAGESDYWRIDVASPGFSTLETTGPTDTIGRLYTVAGEQTAADDDGGDGTNFRIERILAAGTFYAGIRAFDDATGSYTVIANHTALAADEVMELGANTRVTANIGEAEEEDIWRFALPEATVVTVETSGNLDTFGILEDGFGRARSDDDSGRGANFRISSELAAGTHYVRVSAADTTTGVYDLHLHSHLDVDVGELPETAAALPIDTVQDSAIHPIGDVDYWRLEVPSPGMLQVESEGATDVLATLEDARGVFLAEDDDSGFVRNFLLAHPVFPGTYFLRVSGYQTATGAYALRTTHAGNPISIPWFLAARNTAQGRQGFARLINLSEQAGTVRIHAIDDAGANAGAIDIAVQAGETVHFNSDDLERGNAAKGIAAGIGAGVGDWRLVLETELDLNALAYVRTAQGFLTNMHDVVPRRETQGSSNNRYVVPIFNPASNRRQVSSLRLFNLGDERAAVTISGLDDNGDPAPGGGVSLSLEPAAARTLTAENLERGGSGFDGSLGDGRGKWELSIGSTERLGVMNLLASLPAAGEAEATDGNLTNLSTGSPVPAIMPDAHPCTPCEVPLFIAADDPLRQGFVRLSNHSPYRGNVHIHAIDDAGERFGPVTVAINAGATVHFNSDDLERGNAAKGLSGGIGDGVGDWRLEVRTGLDVVGPLAYARTSDGFLTSLHDLVRGSGGAQRRYRVPIFNPASNRDQRSQLRIVNPTPHAAAVSIAGIDDRGQPGPQGEVSFALPAGQSRTIDAEQLERGHGELTGRLGDGTGKWQLLIEADQPLSVLNLLLSANGNLTNLSSSPQR